MKTTNLTQALTKIDEPSQAITLYKITPAEIAKQLKKYDGLKVIEADTKSYKEVRTALTAIVTTRVEVDKRRKQLGEKARELVSNINQAGKMLIEPMTPYEDRFRSELKTEDDRKDAIREEKARIERERIEAIQDKINSIRTMGMMQGKNSMSIKSRLILTRGVEISEEVYQEFSEQAMQAHETSITTLNKILAERRQYEKEEAEREEESERLEAQRKEQAKAQAKIDEENKKIEEQKYNIAQEIKAEDARKEREEFEQQAKEKAEGAAAQKLKDAATAEEERAKTAAAEKVWQEALAPDKEKLVKWIEGFSEIENPKPQLKSKEAKGILRVTWDNIQASLQKGMNMTQKL